MSIQNHKSYKKCFFFGKLSYNMLHHSKLKDLAAKYVSIGMIHTDIGTSTVKNKRNTPSHKYKSRFADHPNLLARKICNNSTGRDKQEVSSALIIKFNRQSEDLRLITGNGQKICNFLSSSVF